MILAGLCIPVCIVIQRSWDYILLKVLDNGNPKFACTNEIELGLWLDSVLAVLIDIFNTVIL